MSTRRTNRQRGVTLIELVLFIVIVSIGVVAVLGVMNLNTKRSADPLRRKQALMIAQGLLEEVELAKFTYCDPVNDGTIAETAGSSGDCTVKEDFKPEKDNARPFDNVNDYVQASNTAIAAFNDATGRLTDANLNPMDVQGYSAKLTIVPAQLGPSTALIGTAGGASADTAVLRITVEVTYDTNRSVVLDGYRTRYAPNAL
jgi:MSHA pilin protein MshD